MAEQQHPQQPIAPLLQAAFGAQAAAVLYVAAKLGLADSLGDGDKSAAELAETLAVNAATLQRILRGLVNLNLCEETEGARFRLTALGRHLRADDPDSVQPRVILNAELHQALWADLLSTIKTGQSASQRVLGMPLYDYLTRNPSVGALFDRAMTSAGWVRYRLRPAIEAYDFGRFQTIVDVGGGNGTLMTELLKKYSEPAGIVFDLPRLAEAARRTIENADLAERCRFIGGDAFDAVPHGANAYIVSNFLITCRDDQAARLLRNCRKGITPDGRLLIVEWLMPSGEEPREGFRFWDTVTMDLTILATSGSGGRVRTRPEFSAVLAAAGFALRNVIPTPASVHVLEAAPV